MGQRQWDMAPLVQGWVLQVEMFAAIPYLERRGCVHVKEMATSHAADAAD